MARDAAGDDWEQLRKPQFGMFGDFEEGSALKMSEWAVIVQTKPKAPL